MKNIAVFTIVLLLFATQTPLLAQCLVSSDGNRPSWISDIRARPKDTPNSDIMVISVNGQSLDEARAKAEQEVYAAKMNRTGKWISQKGPGDIQVRYECLGEHYEYRGGRYRLWQLVRIAKRPHEELDQVKRGETYKLQKNTTGIKPFVPGMAQIYRGDNVSGVLFIAGISALSVGAIAAEVLRSDNNANVNTTFNAAQRRQYIKTAEDCQNTRNILIAAVGAVYLWNVIDGFVGGRGGQGYAFDSDFNIIPYANSQGGGFVLSFNWGNGGR